MFAKIEDVPDDFDRAGLAQYLVVVAQENALVTANSAGTRPVEDVIAHLAESSTDPKVVATREKISDLQENLAKYLHNAAVELQKNATVDLEAEDKVTKKVVLLRKMLESSENFDQMTGLLPTRIKTGTRTAGVQASTTGPKSDKSAVRAWLKENGYEIGDKGPIKAEFLTAYNARQQ